VKRAQSKPKVTVTISAEWRRGFDRQVAQFRILEAKMSRREMRAFENAPVSQVFRMVTVREASARLGHRGGAERRPRPHARRTRVASRGDPEPGEAEPPAGGDPDGLSRFQRALVPVLDLSASELEALIDHCRIRLAWVTRWDAEEAA
jgi:hypothetical protein